MDLYIVASYDLLDSSEMSIHGAFSTLDEAKNAIRTIAHDIGERADFSPPLMLDCIPICQPGGGWFTIQERKLGEIYND